METEDLQAIAPKQKGGPGVGREGFDHIYIYIYTHHYVYICILLLNVYCNHTYVYFFGALGTAAKIGAFPKTI